MKKMLKLKVVAFFLAMATLLSIICVPVSAEDVVAEEPLNENTASDLEPIETEDQIFERLTADSLMLNYIDETAFRAAGHVNRLPEEEDLNSYVFENADGTRTAYILAEPVKYVDNTGEIREKNLTLSTGQTPNAGVMANGVNTGAYTVTATNTPMTFPNDLSQGVRFTYGEYTITLRPETVSAATTIMQADGKVLYRGAFGSTAHLMYTPQLNGLKEDIVLTRYTDQNTFSFIFDTDGLLPASDAGGYYLWDGIDPDMQIRLGQVVSYDANGDFSIGEMTVTPTSGTSYRVTLTVDEDFLQNAFYPVTVDPTLTVTHADNNIIDAPIFEGIPNSNFGTFQYNNVGNAGGSYGKAMTAIKLPGLYTAPTFDVIPDFQIISAKFYIKEASGTASQTVNLYPITTTTAWTETSVKWNTLKNGYDTNYACTTTLSSNSTAYFDITDLVLKWKNETYAKESGFVLTANNATGNKQFHSCESTSTSARPYVVMNYRYGILNPGIFAVAVGETKDIPVTVYPSSCITTWTSDNPSVATIDESGNVVGVATGSTTLTGNVTFIDDNSSLTCTITVKVVPFQNGYYYIRNKSSEKFAQILAASAGSSVVQQPIGGSDVQRWELTYSSKGEYYTIESVEADGYYLAIAESGNANGAPATLGTNANSQYARWVIEETASGAYTLKTLAYGQSPGVVLTVDPFNETSNGAVLQQQIYLNDSNYRDEWELGAWNGAVISLYPQVNDSWCWLGCSQMFASNYVEVTNSQEQLFNEIMNTDIVSSGNMFSIAAAVIFIIGDTVDISIATSGRACPEAELKRYLDDGHPVERNIEYENTNKGHATVIASYLEIDDMCYYVVYDPGPVNIGNISLYTYSELCCREYPMEDGLADQDPLIEIWRNSVMVFTDYSTGVEYTDQ